MQLKSILCPVDFSDFSAAAYQHAFSLAEYYNARLVALHVVELWKYPFADYAAHEADYAKFSAAMNEGGEVQLQRFVKHYSSAHFGRNSSLIREMRPGVSSHLLKKRTWKGLSWEHTAGADLTVWCWVRAPTGLSGSRPARCWLYPRPLRRPWTPDPRGVIV
jgi:hypothetical protein